MAKFPISPDSAFPLRLDDHLTVVGTYNFNLYLFQGRSGSALVETGISAVVDRTIAQLDAMGVEPDYLVVTHPHADHITGLPGLRERFPRATVVAAAGAEKFATHPKAAANMTREDAFMADALAKRGIAPGRAPIAGFDFPEKILEVADDTDLDLGGVSLRCLAAGGHSPGSLLVHCPESRAVTVADSLGFHFPGRCFLPLFFTGYADYLATLKRIASLRPQTVCPGHQGPVDSQALDEAHQATVSLLERILSDDREDEVIAEELFEENYIDDFTLYSPDNIRGCCQLLVRRAREHGAAGERNES